MFLRKLLSICMCTLFFHSSHSKRLQLSCEQIRQFVDGHNLRRQWVARGLVPGQPPASNMKYLVWDEELADKAARWAENGKFSHNPNRSIGSQRWSLIGENLYLTKLFSPLDVVIKPHIEKALNSWFVEHMKYGFMPHTLESGTLSGHYTQMIWADTTHVGCGISQEKVDKYTETLFICDYGPTGNFIGQSPYTPHSRRGRLQCGKGKCSRLYGPHC